MSDRHSHATHGGEDVHYLRALHGLADQAGLLRHWHDAEGRPQALGTDALRTVLGKLDLSCADIGQCEASRQQLVAVDHTLPPLFTADADATVWLPMRGEATPFRLVFEDGSGIAGTATPGHDNWLTLPPVPTMGYHELFVGDLHFTLAVAPPKCFFPALRGDAHRKPWGLATQVYGLRRGADTGMGDLTALADLCRSAAAWGADAVAINPLHAGFPCLPERYSPYSPSSRLFLNPLYADPGAILGPEAWEAAVAALGLGDTLAQLESLREIDWPAVSRARHAILRWLWEHRDTFLTATLARRLDAFRVRGGEGLHSHATYDALQAHLLATGKGHEIAGDWRRWPDEYRQPGSPAVRDFAAAHADEIDRGIFAQWLADEGLAATQRGATDAGMAIGLIADLAVGTDPAGSHAWTRQSAMLNGFSAGAPPDQLNPVGQGWGISVFSPRALRQQAYQPFLEMLRANVAHAGGLRIDHVLGFGRMWLVPDGSPPQAGAYLRYPMEDLLRLVALESHRARAIIVGENLGTVPADLNAALARRGMLGIDVMWFQRSHEHIPVDDEADDVPSGVQAFQPPAEWPPVAMGVTTTHDLPTIAGWWAGNDIRWRARLHQLGPGETEAASLGLRAAERSAMWQALCRAGLAPAGSRPPPPGQPPVAAILRWLATAGTALRMAPVEDIIGEPEQPNLPGTIGGPGSHPNWQRRLDPDMRTLGAGPRPATDTASVNLGALRGDPPPEH